jgi:iron complex transport system permease protein
LNETASKPFSPKLLGKSPRQPLAALLFLAIVLFVALVLDLAAGSVFISPGRLWQILMGRETGQPGLAQIVWLFRMPRLVTAALAGAALGLAGLMMQTLFRNPLADPFILGISAGAGLGVALAVMASGLFFGGAVFSGYSAAGGLALALAASVGAAAVFGLVLSVSRFVANNMTLLILGLLFGYAAAALVSVLMHFSLESGLSAYIRWTFGSFGGVTWSQMKIFAPLVTAGLAGSVFLVKPLNALLLGADYAKTLGANVDAARTGIILCASVLAGVVTAFCGPIGFVGIAAPHLARGVMGVSDHRLLAPGVMLAGAAMTVFADMVAQLPGQDAVLPVNAVTALLGAPVVIVVILRGRYALTSFE